ncbi:NPFFR1 [Branchiostoma lanceolatum]|uniref:NPFFR1 protein n=1 Tax=Branchiostoma lanceolatum TaxID=7740 RepID=A0A8K0E9C4_BRALA|nr:NPFFR1 [Branchiostoma lanceolatum]
MSYYEFPSPFPSTLPTRVFGSPTMDTFLNWNGTRDENASATLATSAEGAVGISTEEVVLEITAMLLIMLATVVGNAAVCWIVISNPKLRTVSNQLVFNLALCDLLTAVVNGPITVVVLVSEKRWNMGDAMCAINGFTTTMFGLASVLTLAVISLNRFAMIVHPQKAGRWFSVWKLRAMIFGL